MLLDLSRGRYYDKRTVSSRLHFQSNSVTMERETPIDRYLIDSAPIILNNAQHSVSTLFQRAEKCFKFNKAGTACSLLTNHRTT
jgi:hypothetical protein